MNFLPIFSIDFQNKILRYARWQDKQLSLAGRLLLIFGLKKMGLNFSEKKMKFNLYKKPYFENENIKFNISHSGDMVVCAITKTCEIGIDVEMLYDIDIDSFRSQMLETEWQRIVHSNNVKVSFFHYWTQKEAVIKGKGKGLSIPLKSFEIIDMQTKIEKESFTLKEIKLDENYVCYLAVGCQNSTLEVCVEKISLFP